MNTYMDWVERRPAFLKLAEQMQRNDLKAVRAFGAELERLCAEYREPTPCEHGLEHDELTPPERHNHFRFCLSHQEQVDQLEQWRYAARKWWDHQDRQAETDLNAVGQPDGYLTQSYAPHFMGVVVGIPDQLGRHTQLYTFGRAGYLGEPITGVDRMIVDALLSHAKNSLYNQVLPAEAQQALNRLAPPPYYGGAY